MIRLLITGVGGQLGTEVFNLSSHENFGIYFAYEPKKPNENLFEVDIRDRNKVFDIVKKIRPNWIVHCAAATKVDWCETHKEEALGINFSGTKNLIDAAKEVNSRFLYVSTDYVFDGERGDYKETDETNPINFYGKTKLDGELYVKNFENYLILRTSHMYSPIGDNFALWSIGKLKSGTVECPNDMISSPTLASELAEAILKSIEKELNGVYHSAGNEPISRYGFAKKIAKIFGYEDSGIRAVKMEAINFTAKRPKNSSLNISKILKEGIIFSDVETCLEKLKTQMTDSDTRLV